MATRTSPARRAYWKRLRPTSLRHALEACKEHAREVRNLGVERIAEQMGLADRRSNRRARLFGHVRLTAGLGNKR